MQPAPHRCGVFWLHVWPALAQVTPVAQVTPWLPLPTMREVVDRALSVARRVQLDFKPLQHQEILSLLLQYPPVPPVRVSVCEPFRPRPYRKVYSMI